MMDEFFNKIEKMFGNNNDSDSTQVGNSGTGTINDEVLRIPVKSMKVGGLRLFLTLYLMGQESKTWKISSDDDTINLFFNDGSIVLSIELSLDESAIIFRRLSNTGSPNMPVSYIGEEGAIVNCILDELDKMAYDDNVKFDDRLLSVERDDVLSDAREKFSFL